MSVDVKKMLVTSAGKEPAISIVPITSDIWDKENKRSSGGLGRGLAKSQGFTGKAGQILIIPRTDTGTIDTILLGIASLDDMWALSEASVKLPKAVYKIENYKLPMTSDQHYKMAVGWALAQYKFKIKKGRLESDPEEGAKLLVSESVKGRFKEIEQEVKATWKTRDLINSPANVLNTRELAREVLYLASEFKISAQIVKGVDLESKFPLIHTVGKASENKPCLTHFAWENDEVNADTPTILLVGKGVTFDTGGLQVKPGASMATMKKDMGGAATAMGLARMVMANDLPVKLQVVIPIAENSISNNAFRPGDVITARDGTEIEIGHTDAEGRLILADALSFGVERCNPDLILDFATLTGAQRVADGLEVGGVFSNRKKEGRRIEDIGEDCCDDLQFHHLFEKYRPLLKSTNGGDILNSSQGPGATMAALFLQHFIRAAKKESTWFHFDVNGMNASSKPGRPKGGEAMGMRAGYSYIKSYLGMR